MAAEAPCCSNRRDFWEKFPGSWWRSGTLGLMRNPNVERGRMTNDPAERERKKPEIRISASGFGFLSSSVILLVIPCLQSLQILRQKLRAFLELRYILSLA